MTKVFALLILGLFSASQVNAAQFGAPTTGDDQFMGDNGAAAGTNGNDDPGTPPAGPEDYGMDDDTAGAGYGDTGDSWGAGTDSPVADSADDAGFQGTDDWQQPDSSQMMGQPQQFPSAGQDMDNGNGDAQGFPQNGSAPSPDSPDARPADPAAGTPAGMTPEDQHQHKLKGMKYIKQLQNALLEGNKQKLCGDSGICRQNFGEGCLSSKNFLSVCATFCSDVHDFRGSHCINSGAKRYHMNPQTFVYAARPQKQKRAESVIQHVMIQLREGRKALRDDKRFFFNVLCTPPSIQMIPQRDRYDISRACLDFLYNGYPPESAIQQLENSNVIQAPTSPQMQETKTSSKAPLGGLPPANGKDLGAKYDGKLPPIIEDKEDIKNSSKKK